MTAAVPNTGERLAAIEVKIDTALTLLGESAARMTALEALYTKHVTANGHSLTEARVTLLEGHQKGMEIQRKDDRNEAKDEKRESARMLWVKLSFMVGVFGVLQALSATAVVLLLG